VKDIAPLALRKDQGSDGAKDVCETPEENAKVMVASLMQTFSKKRDLRCGRCRMRFFEKSEALA
jgi:hypothetical protein